MKKFIVLGILLILLGVCFSYKDTFIDLYYKYLYEKNKKLISKVPLKKKLYLFYENSILKGLIEKK